MLIGLAVFFVFTIVFKIDHTVRATGQITTVSKTQVIQALDGGMLKSLAVREGNRVTAGQILAELEQDRAKAAFEQATSELVSKRISLKRVTAEITGQVPEYLSETSKWPDYVQAQEGVFRQRKKTLDEETTVLTEGLSLAKKEMVLTRQLGATGDVSSTEVMRAERQVLEIQSRINSVQNKYFSESRAELAKLQDEISLGESKFQDRESILKHTTLISPMDGVVKLVRLNTVGGVLKPGDELMQISPADEKLVIQLKVNPSDIGQLKLGLPVNLRFDAFDSSIFGSVAGLLRYVSPDTLSETGPDGQTQLYYRAEVEILFAPEEGRLSAVQPNDIKPGMTATADILVGQRTLFTYLTKPIFKSFSGALSER
jgi:adhesin transport system membrane fusion protein